VLTHHPKQAHRENKTTPRVSVFCFRIKTQHGTFSFLRILWIEAKTNKIFGDPFIGRAITTMIAR
jgi:hypothetical protein